MKDKILIKEFLKDKNVGAIASSTNKLVKEIINEIDFEKTKIIVEYGPGKGVITKQLLKQLKDDAVLFVFETNEQFINGLSKINDDRLIIINSDAENSKIIINHKYKIQQVDYVISTIPFTFFDRKKRQRIIFRSYELLQEKGKFITAQYSWLVYHYLKEKFSKSSIKPILKNIPPTFIMEGVK